MKKAPLLAFVLLLALSISAQNEPFCDSVKAKEVFSEDGKERIDFDRVQRHLSEAIQIKTVSYTDESLMDWTEFERFHVFLEQAYPLVHQTLRRERISKASLLYTWQGKRTDLDPIAILAHIDVVPAEDSEEEFWQHPPFSGFNDGQFIWGRGTLDMKNVLVCVMEAVETLLEEGYVPERTVYLCFGHNEETTIDENSGAKEIVRTLKDRGVHLESTIDEGGAILSIDIEGLLRKNIVGIGIAEKGYADVKITVNSQGGHSSHPPQHTAAGMLANVVRDLERHPFCPEMIDIIDDMFHIVGENTEFPFNLLIPIVLNFKLLASNLVASFPQGATFVRTTQACTMLEGSPAPNVLPQTASVVVNYRLLPGTTMEDIKRHIRKVVRNKDIDIEVICCKEASTISPTDSRAYTVLTELSRQRDEKNVVIPYLVTGCTDSFHYEPICENIYRYSPFLLELSQLLTTHAANERCPIKQLAEGIRFYKMYIKKMTEKLQDNP